MPSKSFLEKFNKFVPESEQYDILQGVSDYSLRVNKENRIIEAVISMDKLVPKEKLYRIERGIAKAYDLNYVKLLPKYPSELFSYDYVPQILKETESVGIVAKGFFSNYTYDLDDSMLTVYIPFTQNGVRLLEDANTPKVIEKIILSEFGIHISVTVKHTKELDGDGYSEAMRRELEALDKYLMQADAEYERHQSQRAEQSFSLVENVEEKSALPRIQTVYNEDATPVIENGICKIGHSKFDISEPKYVIGEVFEIKPSPISFLTKPIKNVVVLGEVFGVTKDTNRTGDKINLVFNLTDGNASIELKKFGMDPDYASEVCETIKDGAVLAIKGNARFDMKKDHRDEDLTMTFESVAEIGKISRKDNAEKKRVELHLHTQMSSMDAIIPPDVAVKTAKKWGHPAVAITDHGNVQGFPEAMMAAEKCDMKVIYGMEAYFVNDTAGAATGKISGISFND